MKNDPQKQNKNGALFENFMRKNPEMHLLNASDICERLITRTRKVGDKSEISAIDFVLVCDKILPYVSKFYIDEQKMYALTKYSKKSMVHSDHNTLFGYMNLKIQKSCGERKTIFNFRNSEDMQKFKQITTNTSRFTNCFKSSEPISNQVSNWHKILKHSLKTSFKKVRVKNQSFKYCKKFKARKNAIKNNKASGLRSFPPSCPRQIQKVIIRKKLKCSFVYPNKYGQI